MVIALVSLGIIGWQYLDAQNKYRDIESVAGLDVDTLETVSADTKLEDIKIDWAALKLINTDVVGWIIVPGTNINYPLVQSYDNVYYLNHLFDKSTSASGAIFLDEDGSATLDGQNNVIYGHNMLDGSMFANVREYANQGFFDTHRVVFLCTPERNYELSAIAALNVSENAPLRQFSFASDEAFTTFVRSTLASPTTSVSNLSSVIADAKSLYSLVTCEANDASVRFVLSCIPVRSVELNAQ